MLENAVKGVKTDNNWTIIKIINGIAQQTAAQRATFWEDVENSCKQLISNQNENPTTTNCKLIEAELSLIQPP